MAKVIAICGKICSGKSYYSNQVKGKERAVVLSCDELTKALFDNNLVENYEAMTLKIKNYLKWKSVDFVNVGCTVILDWGFWSLESRKSLTEFYRMQSIPCEWHYVDVDDWTWRKNIEERNHTILNGQNSFDYYLDKGLIDKLLCIWETPDKDEIDVWYTLKRK